MRLLGDEGDLRDDDDVVSCRGGENSRAGGGGTGGDLIGAGGVGVRLGVEIAEPTGLGRFSGDALPNDGGWVSVFFSSKKSRKLLTPLVGPAPILTGEDGDGGRGCCCWGTTILCRAEPVALRPESLELGSVCSVTVSRMSGVRGPRPLIEMPSPCKPCWDGIHCAEVRVPGGRTGV